MSSESKNHPFPSLESATSSHDTPGPKRILIVSEDIAGSTNDGGIGWEHFHSAKQLASLGHDVTILSTLDKLPGGKNKAHWEEEYSTGGVRFVHCTRPRVPVSPGIIGLAGSIPYKTYEWLKLHEEQFDVVQTSDRGANLYYCLVAKQLGLYFRNIHFVVKASNPLLWDRISSNEPIRHYDDLPRFFMERKSVEWADHVISGSHYMLNWMEKNGYELPDGQCFVQPAIYPAPQQSETQAEASGTPRELVFFGGLERRKGLHLLLDALRRLVRSHSTGETNLEGIRFTFLFKGKTGRKLKKEIAAVLNGDAFTHRIIDNHSQSDAIRYLTEGSGKLAILPSIIDSSPSAIYELLGNRIPFITSMTGGGKELIDRDDRDRVLFDAHPHAIHQRLLEVLGKPLHITRPGYEPEQNRKIWNDWYLALPALKSDKPKPIDSRPKEAQPFVSICLAHFNRPQELSEALGSIKSLDYKNFEVVIVDDGSTNEKALAYLEEIQKEDHGFPLAVYSQPNLYLGASRNLAASHAQGEYILFMDDDNLAKQHELSTLVEAIEHANADIITCFSDTFRSKDLPISSTHIRKRIVFVGADLSSGMFRNPYGDSNCMVRRSAFEKLGGFTEDYKIGRDDQEFFSRATLKGLKLYVLPEAVYWYRLSDTRMRHSQFSLFAGMQRVGNPFIEIPDLPIEYANILRYTQGLAAVKLGVVANTLSQAAQSSLVRRIAYTYPLVYRAFKWLHRQIS